MIRRALPLMLLPLSLVFAVPAFADVADGTDGGEDTSTEDDDDDDDDDDDKGCSTAGLTPVTGASLLLGAALVFGLRRRD
jgi:uncharacterized protein (TIGR03382 family)